MGFKILQTPYIFAQSVIAFVRSVHSAYAAATLHVLLQLCKIFIEKVVDSEEALIV